MTEFGDKTDPALEIDLLSATGSILSVIESGSIDKLDAALDEYIGRLKEGWEKLLLEAFGQFVHEQFGETVDLILRANNELPAERRQEIPEIYSEILIKAQMALPRRARRATVIGQEYYQKNIEALRKIDSQLASEVEQADWPTDLVLIAFWSGLHLFAPAKEVLMILNEQVVEEFEKHVAGRKPIAFGRIQTGQELQWFLQNQFVGLHGMTRPHYLFEPDAGKIKALLHMYNLSDVLGSKELMIFGGESMEDSFDTKFQMLHYALPDMIIGDNELVNNYIERFGKYMNSLNDQSIVQEYYNTEEFRRRQCQIASGEIMPRILVYTCRWTTFLKYCASDFEKAFKRLGCKTYFQIEVSDVQTHYIAMDWRIMKEFKPDMLFLVSHGRPSVGHFPKEIPVLAFIQDRCGPILALEDMTGHIESHDIFACQASEIEGHLLEKKVPVEQSFILPVPADNNIYYPLGPDDPGSNKFSVDIAFVKHGHPHPDKVFNEFLEANVRNVIDFKLKNKLEKLFNELYRRSYVTGSGHLSERDMHEYISSEIGGDASGDLHAISQMVTVFNVMVCTASWRSQFLEALERSGLNVRLYGKNWDKYPQLSRLSHGEVGHNHELNQVYNFSRINLHINQVVTMHQRVTECGMAGGFIMAADIPESKDWEPARRYFDSEKELVYFDGPDDMVDKCRYYLEHPDKRMEIAENLHQRVQAEQTVDVAAGRMLEKWKQVFSAIV